MIDAIDMAAPPTLLATLFRGLADPSRLSCLLALRDGPHTVGEVVAATGLGQPTASKHLACLRDCGLVQAQRSGRFVTYCMCGTGVRRNIQQLRDDGYVVCEPVSGFSMSERRRREEIGAIPEPDVIVANLEYLIRSGKMTDSSSAQEHPQAAADPERTR
jgi:DNA-binding transcriptional ArsR family regulator